MRSLATRTKRLSWWKKPARLKNPPLKVNSSGTVSRPGALAPWGVAVELELDPEPALLPSVCAVFESAVALALFAFSAACPGPVEAFSPPAAEAGVLELEPLELELLEPP